MKRQDMLHKIAGALGLIMTTPSMNVEQGAELILSIIEDEGMLPPKRYRDMDWNETGLTYSQWCQLPSKINEWNTEPKVPNAVVIPEDHDPQF